MWIETYWKSACFSQVGPQKLCNEVCSELASHLSLHAHQVALCEFVLGGALKRYLHHSEKVLDTVLRWGYWDEADRAQNFLVLVPNTVFQELQSVVSLEMFNIQYTSLWNSTYKVIFLDNVAVTLHVTHLIFFLNRSLHQLLCPESFVSLIKRPNRLKHIHLNSVKQSYAITRISGLVFFQDIFNTASCIHNHSFSFNLLSNMHFNNS